MLKVSSQDKVYELAFNGADRKSGTLNGESFELDSNSPYPNAYKVTRNNETYHVELVKADWDTKELTVRVNGFKHELKVKDKFDLWLEEMGMGDLTVIKITDVKAPMPGLVLDILVEPGQKVTKGDSLMVLEAMKMENSIKSPADGVIKEILVERGNALEKNTVMMTFE